VICTEEAKDMRNRNRNKWYFLLLLLAFLSTVPGAQAGDLPAVKASGVLLHLGIPYANFVTSDGKGLDAELMRLFADHLGVRYQYVPTNWEDAIADLTGKKYRIGESDARPAGETPRRGDVLANGFTILPVRKEMVDFSCPTFPSQIWLVARSDSLVGPIRPNGNVEQDVLVVRSLLTEHKVMGKPNTCLDPSLYSLTETGATVVNFSGEIDQMVPALMNGDAEFSLLDMPTALIALEKWPGSIKIIGPLSPPQAMGCAFAKDTPLLRDAFNNFFSQILLDGTYLKLMDKYYPSLSRYYPEAVKGIMVPCSKNQEP
jgi:ABC-type amino acid transport substrate-binding protein